MCAAMVAMTTWTGCVVLPRDKASDFREARFGFRDRELAQLEIVDKLGQRSKLQFTNVQRNPVVDPAEVQLPATAWGRT